MGQPTVETPGAGRPDLDTALALAEQSRAAYEAALEKFGLEILGGWSTVLDGMDAVAEVVAVVPEAYQRDHKKRLALLDDLDETVAAENPALMGLTTLRWRYVNET